MDPPHSSSSPGSCSPGSMNTSTSRALLVIATWPARSTRAAAVAPTPTHIPAAREWSRRLRAPRCCCADVSPVSMVFFLSFAWQSYNNHLLVLCGVVSSPVSFSNSRFSAKPNPGGVGLCGKAPAGPNPGPEPRALPTLMISVLHTGSIMRLGRVPRCCFQDPCHCRFQGHV